MRTGILGGTFNPPHYGHLHAAKQVKEALNLDKVLFIPTNLPPHKKMPKSSANTHQRCEMIKLMIDGLEWAELSMIEIERGGSSYTIDTLRELNDKKIYGELFFLMGTDMLMTLDTGWREPEEICKLCTLAVVARGLNEHTILKNKAQFLREKYNAKIYLIDADVIEISSTEIRNGQKLSEMLPKTVLDYIRKNRLYMDLTEKI